MTALKPSWEHWRKVKCIKTTTTKKAIATKSITMVKGKCRSIVCLYSSMTKYTTFANFNRLCSNVANCLLAIFQCWSHAHCYIIHRAHRHTIETYSIFMTSSHDYTLPGACYCDLCQMHHHHCLYFLLQHLLKKETGSKECGNTYTYILLRFADSSLLMSPVPIIIVNQSTVHR